MKQFLLFLLLIGFVNCRQDSPFPNADVTTLNVAERSSWTTEDIDTRYVIQFPKNYSGGIGPTIEGPQFSLKRSDDRAYFLGQLGYTFQSLLPASLPDSVQYARFFLNKKVYFQRNGQLQGVFYYAQQTNHRGQLFLNYDGTFMQYLSIQYDAELHREVLGILQTIRPH